MKMFGTTISESKLAICTKPEDGFTLHSSISIPKFIHKEKLLHTYKESITRNEMNELEYDEYEKLKEHKLRESC